MSPVQCFSLLTTLQNSTGHILSGSVPEGVNTWAVFKYIFHLPLEGLKSACWPFKALQSNISHAPNFAESLGSDCFCNLHPAGLLIGFSLHTALHVVGCQHY